MAQEAAPSPLFRVGRKEPELVVPIKPSPRELKLLSDLDNLEALRLHVSIVMMYRNNPSMNGKDPVEVIKKAVAQALVYYYPLAGRLREGTDRKLSVDCTDQGVLFVEADADFALDDFGQVLMPPFPCLGDLVIDVPASGYGFLHSPLVFIQVTRLKCGGFIFAMGINHAMSDAQGKGQFISAISEMARGALSPSTLPCWSREFFSTRDPPAGMRHVDDDVVHHDTTSTPTPTYKPLEDVIEKSFRFSRAHVSALRALAPERLRPRCSTFDLLTACLWRSRTVALQLNPGDQVCLTFPVNARGRNFNPPVPAGYYGNAMATTVASSTAGSLCGGPFGYALELVMKAKADMTEEYIRSVVDQIAAGRGAINPLPELPPGRCFYLTDVRHIGQPDFGWGAAAYTGPSFAAAPPEQSTATYYVKCDDDIVAPLHLPRAAMKIFETQLHAMSFNGFIRSGL